MEKIVRVEPGIACDQEKFLKLLPEIVEFVRQDGTEFDSYDYTWQYAGKYLEFEVRFYVKC